MLSQALRLAGKAILPVPTPAVGLVGGWFRRAGLADFSPEQIKFLTYGRGLDTTRLRDRFGFVPVLLDPGRVRGVRARARSRLRPARAPGRGVRRGLAHALRLLDPVRGAARRATAGGGTQPCLTPPSSRSAATTAVARPPAVPPARPGPPVRGRASAPDAATDPGARAGPDVEDEIDHDVDGAPGRVDATLADWLASCAGGSPASYEIDEFGFDAELTDHVFMRAAAAALRAAGSARSVAGSPTCRPTAVPWSSRTTRARSRSTGS